MFEKNDKRRLYWLMDQYLTGNMSAEEFHDEYYYCFGLELNSLNLTPAEEEAFTALSKISDRFSCIPQDLIDYPGVYYNEQQLREKVIEAKKLLDHDKKVLK